MCVQDPPEKYFKMQIQLDSWQQEILDCKDKYILLCKGRQIGGTFIMARKCADRMISKKGCQIVVASITEDQAQLVIAMVLSYLEKNYKSYIKRPYSRNITKSVIKLNNKSQIISRPVGTTGNAVRGFTGHVLYLNEASRMPEFIFEAAKPILLTTAGDIWMDSTPKGMEGYFYKSWINKNKRFKVFYYTSEEVIKNRKISESWTIEQKESALKFLEEEKEDMTNYQYRQEYLGEFVGGIQRFVPDELINARCNIDPTKPYIPIGDKFQGIDLARMGGDEIVLTSFDRIQRKRLRMFDLEIPQGQKLTDTTRLIINKDKIINHKKIYLDDGGMGVGVLDPLLEDPQTRRKVEGLNNAQRSIEAEKDGKSRKKGLLGEDMAVNLKVLMENGDIDLFDNERVKQSLRSMQFDYSDGKLKIYGNYAHIFEAMKRGAYCMKDKTLNIYIY
ncbi:hypothetical protein LCGC14_0851800 [marine sediment metagenome]|uniref:Uncharacterized protein n=1 Tax=marine sediment metagenome TaxID=412755 RepID=A0A0F9SH18_9ZZZZ